MTLWKSFGASVRGPSHIAEGLPNQDAWAAFHHVWGDGIVVSDGVGSKPFSNFGSHAVCRAVERAAHACCVSGEIERNSLFSSLQDNWLRLIAPLEPRDCAATCLLALRMDGAMHLGMLGDGLAAAVMRDGTVVSLSENKTQGFSNITTALSSNVSAKDWQYLSLPGDQCVGVLLCTDGVADDLDNADGFVTSFVEAHRNLASVSASRRIHEMLENWPTPRHSDDKTIACLCREEVVNE